MNYIYKSSVALLIALSFFGCGYKQTNVQNKDVGYLKFNRSFDKNYEVVLNDNNQFPLSVCLDKNNCVPHDELYEVKSGKVNIKIYDNKTLIYSQDKFIGQANTIEIDLQ